MPPAHASSRSYLHNGPMQALASTFQKCHRHRHRLHCNTVHYRGYRHTKVRLVAIEALWMIVKVPDRAKVKGAGTSAIVDLVGFREDNVLPVAAFYGRGDTTVNYLAQVRNPIHTLPVAQCHTCYIPVVVVRITTQPTTRSL